MLELRVGEATAASVLTEGPIPMSAVVSDETGSAIGELFVWVGGYISALEFSWWTDEPPEHLPTSDRVRIARK